MKDINIISMLCWSLWNCRNNLVWNQKGKEVREVVELATLFLVSGKVLRTKILTHHLGS